MREARWPEHENPRLRSLPEVRGERLHQHGLEARREGKGPNHRPRELPQDEQQEGGARSVISSPPAGRSRQGLDPKCRDEHGGARNAESTDGKDHRGAVLVACGTYHDCTHMDPGGQIACIIMKDGVVLTSEGADPDCVTVDAQTLARCVYCGAVDPGTLIQGFTFINGRAPEWQYPASPTGGGMICKGGAELRVRDCVFSGSYASGGGGIACHSSSPIFEELEVTGNSADGFGGGIVCWYSDVTVTGGRITYNTAESGRGLCSNWGGLAMTGVLVAHNEAEIGGGGLDVAGGSPVLTDCEMNSNVALAAWGGGAYLGFCSPTLSGCSFALNEAVRGEGLGLFSCENYGPAHLTECDFYSNAATEAGGDLMASFATTVTFADCSFRQNVSEIGGGVALDQESIGSMVGCSFTENTCSLGGGAVTLQTASLAADACTMVGNTSAVYGGGIQAESGATVSLTSCLLVANQSTYSGGAIRVNRSTALSVAGCTLAENASLTGGSLALDDSAPVVIENTIVAFGGGGEAVTCTGVPPVVQCTDIYGNVGGDWTGCISGLIGTGGNMSEDPLFCGASNPDDPYALHSNSPCSAEANVSCGLIGARDVNCGSTPVACSSWGVLKAMFR